MLSKTFLLLVIFVSLLNASQAFYRKKDTKENRHASAKEMKALLEESSRRRANEVAADGAIPDKGDKIISRNGDAKIDGDEIELSFMVVSFVSLFVIYIYERKHLFLANCCWMGCIRAIIFW